MIVGLAALSAWPGREALAQAPSDAASREADALFKEGRSLYDEHKLDLACAKLAESQRLRASINTAGLLAGCHEEQGLLATALRDYLKTEELARAAGDPRGAFARERADILRPKVPVLVIRVARATEGLVVTRSGEPVAETELGAEVLVNPGEIEIRATAPGRKEWKKTISMTAGAKQSIEVPELESAEPATSGASGGGRAARVVGFVLGGVGVAAIGVGSGLGALAIGKKKESDEKGCNAQSACPPAGFDARQASRSLALGSTIGFAVGLASVGAGLTLVLLNGDKPDQAAPAAGGLTLHLSPFGMSPGSGARAVLSGAF